MLTLACSRCRHTKRAIQRLHVSTMHTCQSICSALKTEREEEEDRFRKGYECHESTRPAASSRSSRDCFCRNQDTHPGCQGISAHVRLK
jgi:hypothetical protein